MMGSVPECRRIGGNDDAIVYDGDWGESYFNYRKEIKIWNFVSFVVCTALWFGINEGIRLFMMDLPEVARVILFWIVLLLSIGVCMALSGWISDVMFDHVQMKVKRYQNRRNGIE